VGALVLRIDLALVFGVAVLLREDGPTLEWAFVASVYAMQAAILWTPDVREYIRRASYERESGRIGAGSNTRPRG